MKTFRLPQAKRVRHPLLGFALFLCVVYSLSHRFANPSAVSQRTGYGNDLPTLDYTSAIKRNDVNTRATAHSDSAVANSREVHGITPLSPGKRGRCWFHSQVAHKQDREMFKKLGGMIDDTSCKAAGVIGARYSSEAEICTCTAPPASSFGKHFLEIGSADGQYLSNLLFFEMQLNWRGICVEGSPVSFEMLQRNRPDCTNVNAVIGSTQDQAMFYTFDSPNSWEVGMSCMQGTECGKNDDEAQKYADERNLKLHKQNVPMRKLSDIFAENNMNDFGWIMVDVEGAEDIVVPTIDLSKVRADYISYEANNGADHVVARKHLMSSGYEVKFTVGPDKFYMTEYSPIIPNATK